MPRFADATIAAFLDAIASPEPTPGGGSAAAIGGALGTALLMMVAGLQKTRGNTDRERAALAEVRAALTSVRERLLALADRDTEAYNKVARAMRLPKGSDAEKAARRQALQQGLREATETPLEIVRTAAEALQHARTVAQYGNPAAASDVRVAIELLEAAGAGAAANVEINLAGIDDEPYKKSAAATMIELSNALTKHSASACAALGES